MTAVRIQLVSQVIRIYIYIIGICTERRFARGATAPCGVSVETRETRTRGKLLAFLRARPRPLIRLPPPTTSTFESRSGRIRVGWSRGGDPSPTSSSQNSSCWRNVTVTSRLWNFVHNRNFTTVVAVIVVAPRILSRVNLPSIQCCCNPRLSTNDELYAGCKFNSRSKRFVPLRTRINFCDKNYNTKYYYFGRYFIRRRSDWRIK